MTLPTIAMTSESGQRRATAVDRAADISARLFLQDYYAPQEPVVLEGVFQSWPARRQWTPGHFARQYGEVEIEIMTGLHGDPHYQRECSRSRRAIRMREFVALVETDSAAGDSYLVAQNQALRLPALAPLLQDLTFPCDLLEAEPDASRVSLWFGSANTVTPLHYDLQNTLLAQAYGRKRVSLIAPVFSRSVYNERGGYSAVDPESPDLDRFPLFAHVEVRTVELEAGDALFIPVGWWHHVRSLTVSISVSFGNFAWPNPCLSEQPPYEHG